MESPFRGVPPPGQGYCVLRLLLTHLGDCLQQFSPHRNSLFNSVLPEAIRFTLKSKAVNLNTLLDIVGHTLWKDRSYTSHVKQSLPFR